MIVEKRNFANVKDYTCTILDCLKLEETREVVS